jgi:hypothetical protein
MSISSFSKYMYTSPYVCWDEESGGATHDVNTVFTRRGGVFGAGAPPAKATVPVHMVIEDARQLQNNTLTTTKMRLLQQQQKQLLQDFFV